MEANGFVSLSREDVERTVRAVYGRAGFGLGFPGAADESDWQCPRPFR